MNTVFIKLHPTDNVLITVENIQRGQEISIDGKLYSVGSAVPRYFKIAARKILKGEKIIKYGMSIGVAIESIEMADLVHTHNIKSDYMTSFTGKNETANI